MYINDYTHEYYNSDVDKREVTEFIEKVFNFYNGKINKNFSAILNINWMYHTFANFIVDGEHYSPCGIVIHPANLCIEYWLGNIDKRILFIELTKTIIHELFHQDQVISSYRYYDDYNYRCYIEYAVISMTERYVATNIKEITELTGYEPYIDYESMKLSTDLHYHRKKMIDHILQFFSTFLDVDGDSDHAYVLRLFLNKGYKFTLYITNDIYTKNSILSSLTLSGDIYQDKDYIVDEKTFNEFIINNVYNNHHLGQSGTDNVYYSFEVIIEPEPELKIYIQSNFHKMIMCYSDESMKPAMDYE